MEPSVTPSVVEPGMTLLRQRAAKAAAVLSAERSRDVADFVLCSSLMDEALDLLGPHMSSPLATPAAELARGLAAALKAHTLVFDVPLHYRGFVRVFAAHCYPLVSASDVPSGDPTVLNATISSPTDELFHLLREWANPNTVTLLKAALTVPTLAGALHPQGETARLSLATSAAVLQRLARPAAAEAYEAELARMQAGTPSERQLLLADLRQLCLRHRLMLAGVLAYVHPSLPAPLAADAAELSVPVAAFGPGSSLALKQLALSEALQLRRLCPSHPRYAYEAVNLSAQLGSLSATQQHLREAVQLAQAADHPLWLARAGHARVSLEALALTIPANELSLQDMRQLKRQADAAFQVCCDYLPQSVWMLLKPGKTWAAQDLEETRSHPRQARTPLAASRLSALILQAYLERIEDGHPGSATPLLCAGCGLQSQQLKTCTACRSVSYCSRECQRTDWPNHRRTCQAARSAIAN